MKSPKNNKKLDELISRTVGREKPEFDFDKWKQEHEKEIDIFESQEKSTWATFGSNIWRIMSWKKAGRLAAAVLIAGIAFLGGRLSIPRTLPRSMDIEPRVAAERDGVTVPSHLIAWLDAARLFRQLGMEDRMARAVERASRLLPYDAVAGSSATGQAFTANSGEEVFENQNKHSILSDILGPHESVESAGGIIAQSFGGYNYASSKD